jgi:hypothetical protein
VSGITALPPSSVPPDDGGCYYVCNIFEWTATIMEKGDPCWFSKKFELTSGKWYPGTFKLAWFYDGVIADVVPDGASSTVGLLLNMGDRIITPEDHATLEQWEARPR